MDPPPHQVTQILHALSEGDQAALDQLLPAVYDDLHRLAQYHMVQERPNHTLQATALVNEAYLRLLGSEPPSWQDRSHFLAVCARVMRHILVDSARALQTGKRGNGLPALTLEEAVAEVGRAGTDLSPWTTP